MFTKVCGGKFKKYCLNTFESNENCILFDSVQIFNCVQNNWMNQTD